MRIDVLLILFLALWDGRAALIRAQTAVYEAAKGGNITVQCWFYFGGWNKTFCKNDCDKEEDILVKTSENIGCDGRYSIKYKGNGLFSDSMYVSITNVTSSDSGRYQCVLGRGTNNGYHRFKIKVTNVETTDYIQSSTSETTTEQAPVPSEHSTTASGAMLYVVVSLFVKVILLSLPLVIYCRKRIHQNKESGMDAAETVGVTKRNRVSEEVLEEDNVL